MPPNPKEPDNRLRWDGCRRGWYEVYYLKWNDRRSRTAGWVRYTLTSPLPRKGPPYCELWGAFFAAEDPARNFAVKQRFAIDRLRWERESFGLRLAGAELDPNACRGAVADQSRGRSLSWELRFDSSGPTLYHYPWNKLYRLPLPRTKILSPHPDARVSGSLMVDGREIGLEDAPGEQAHLWGTRHPLRWAWGHCNTFGEDPGAVFEGLDGQVKHGPVPSAHFKMFYLKAFGEQHLFNAAPKWLTNRSRWRLGRWEFRARNRRVFLQGEVNSRPAELVGVTYQDPDGEPLWCNHSEVASFRLWLRARDGRLISELTSERGGAVEFADRRVHPGVRIQI